MKHTRVIYDYNDILFIQTEGYTPVIYYKENIVIILFLLFVFYLIFSYHVGLCQYLSYATVSMI